VTLVGGTEFQLLESNLADLIIHTEALKDRLGSTAVHLVATHLLNLIPYESSFGHAFALRLLHPALRARLQVEGVPPFQI